VHVEVERPYDLVHFLKAVLPQKRIAEAYVDQLNKARVFGAAIATKVSPLQKFYEAESYQQDYLAHHPDEIYIIVNDQPKVENLKKQFPDLYKAK